VAVSLCYQDGHAKNGDNAASQYRARNRKVNHAVVHVPRQRGDQPTVPRVYDASYCGFGRPVCAELVSMNHGREMVLIGRDDSSEVCNCLCR
jgi:hypothetical protein